VPRRVPWELVPDRADLPVLIVARAAGWRRRPESARGRP
jgi:hypothetical protein